MASMRTPLSYAAAVSGSNGESGSIARYQASSLTALAGDGVPPSDGKVPPRSRTPSPSRYRPHGVAQDDAVYIVTLLTDQPHHDRMTRLRTRYFPKRINKLDAHLTLFHALPGSKLESSVIPVLQDVAQHTVPFRLLATKPFRLKHGIALSVAKNEGARQAQEVHRALLEPWLKQGFLSEQDRGGCNVHYTIMNKVDDELEVAKALEEVRESFKPDNGTAEGLGLWRYDRGWWRWERRFDFAG
ncbi:hypothetical protein LTR35_004103 [Friedmanniomyces endolithicus]|nr:hypothetical protein LTR35_004103 [Friedmanniomyces endolithicus]KAK0300077.1 hypothetical protein LTS00_001149 [Friedmanniomyces endolithicus]KAK0999380.1 hypothetical protein LTR54_009125 [Friedmanniomyces endolithicus]